MSDRDRLPGGMSAVAPVTRLGVLGWPVAHSRSPAIQNAALAAVGLADWRYQRLPVPPELFAETVRGLPAVGFVGANVTIPHKAAALALAHAASPRARAIGAANTLLLHPDAAIHADNTDGPGLLDALRARAIDPAGVRVQVLGAGGTARAAVWALLDAGADVAVWNRTPERARALCAELGGRVVDEPEPASIVIQTTSAELSGGSGLPAFSALGAGAEGIRHARVLVEFVYGSAPTALATRAASLGVEVIDGLELLVRQGALSFELFTGRPAPVERMLAAAPVGR